MAEGLLSWATISPESLNGGSLGQVCNLTAGTWKSTIRTQSYPDPVTGSSLFQIPETQIEELPAIIEEIQATPAFGLHNPLRNTERYNLYGQISAKVAEYLSKNEIFDYFARLIMRTVPKSRSQAEGEVKLVRNFLQNFSGDQVRFLARGFSVPGDHLGQETHGYRWPYGPVAIIAPFNFPVEIPVLQLFGALYMGNKVLIKPDPKGAPCLEQFIRLMIHCGMPSSDVIMVNGGHVAIEEMVKRDLFKCIQFTGSTKIAHHLSEITKGKVRFEDSGYNWKILGPEVTNLDYTAYVSDQDAYAFSGQKCSAQRVLLAHSNWIQAGIIDKITALAQRRSLSDLTITPILTWTNERIQSHVDKLLALPGARLLFGGASLENHSIPAVYGAYAPTAIFIPFTELMGNVELCTVEVFGPLQIVTEWSDLPAVVRLINSIGRYLTAGIVSNDPVFLQEILGSSVNGTTYVGVRARTSGAPQNHWFGAAGDPRGSGIGTIESILQTWSCHREIITDYGPVPSTWSLPPAS